MPEALILLAMVLMAVLCVAVQLPSAAHVTALVVFPLVILYPLAKRYTRYPQLVLALTFNWGVWVGWYAAYDNLSLTTIFLYLAAVCWTMAYDTIYAYQDKADDEKIGVKSTAVTFGARGAVWVGRFYTGMAIFLFLALMTLNATLYHYAAIGFSIGLFLSLTYHRPFIDQPNVATALFHLNAVLGGIVALTLLF
jgi:4-hydroxybenzoate polyprenyltransferase